MHPHSDQLQSAPAPSSRVLLAALLLSLPACQTTPTATFSPTQQSARQRMEEAIAKEPVGPYFIGRRYYKEDYKMWGYIRKPRQPWHDSQLAVLNENRTLAPDRAAENIGSDNGHEYRLWGRWTGDRVYEPAANQFYPEFLLEKAEPVSKQPAPIFRNPRALDPKARIYPDPE
jgi:hypothetical protein